MSTRRVGIVAALVCAALLVAGCMATGSRTRSTSGEVSATTGAKSTLVVAVAGMVTPKAGLDYYQELADYLGRKVGRTVRLIHKTDYTQCNRMLSEDKVDVAFVCSGPYASGHDSFGLELLAAPVVNGSATYRCDIIVARSSTATSLASLRGKTFAFTDPLSNTGRGVPTYMLVKMGSTPDTFFHRWFYTYSHDNSIKAVADGAADGAAVDSLIYDFYTATQPALVAKTRILERSEPYGIPPVVARPGLDAGLKRQLREALLGADKDPEGRAILEKMRIQRFTTIEDSAYDTVRAMLKATESIPTTPTP